MVAAHASAPAGAGAEAVAPESLFGEAEPAAATPEESLAPAPPYDPLLECLALVSRIHQRPLTGEALTSGLPLDQGRLTPALLPRAAGRAGLSARLVKRPLRQIPDFLLPAILFLKEGDCCVLVARHKDGGLEIALPEAGGGTLRLPAAELEERYLGRAFFLRPEYRFDGRQEEESSGKVTGTWFWGTLRKLWPSYAQVVVAAGIVNMLALASPLFVMNVYDRVLPNQAFSTLWFLAAGMGVALLFDFLLRNLRGALIDTAGRRADVLMASRIFEHVLDLKLRHRPGSTGAFANRLREFESVRDFFTSATLASLTDLLFVGLFLAIIWMIGGLLVLVPAAAVTLALLVGFSVQFPLNRVVRESQREAAQKHAILVETLGGLETLKAVGAQGRMQRNWEEFVGTTARTSQKSRFISGLGVNLTTFLQQFTTVGIVVGGVYLASEGEISLGAIIACVILGGRAVAPLAGLANTLSRMTQAIQALRSLNHIMALPVERTPGRRFTSRPRLDGAVEFRGVSFAYPQAGMAALSDVSFTVKPGERVGIIGRVGSGKTTVARLLCGLYEPDEGAVLLDGMDLRQLHPADMRRNIGILMQDVTLFHGTVRENICIGMPHADDEAVLRAARLAGAHDFIGAHPQGYDMLIGERGENLSGGQRQAIALARALLPDPPILLLDEPTSAMDMASEKAMIGRLRELVSSGRTLVLTTHRASLLELVDRLLVLDRGRLVADGPRDKVIADLNKGRIRAGGR